MENKIINICEIEGCTNKKRNKGNNRFDKICDKHHKQKYNIKNSIHKPLTNTDKERQKIWKTKNYEKVILSKRKYNSENTNKILLANAKHRAFKKGLEFNLEIQDISIPNLCPILKIPLKSRSKNMAGGKSGPLDSAPSIDRIDPQKGYIKGNIMVISLRANRIKSNATIEELLTITNFLKNLNQK